MELKEIVERIESFRNTGTEQARLQKYRFHYENEFLKVVFIETSNKQGGNDVKNGKLWSIKFNQKQPFTHLQGWANLKSYFGKKLEMTLVQEDGAAEKNYFGIRLREMSKEPSDEVVRKILDFIFQEVRFSDLIADDQLKDDIEQVVERIRIKTSKDIPTKPAAEVDTPAGKTYKRDPEISAQALFDADFLCEYGCSMCRYFERKKNSKNYTEPHHLIPMRFQKRFTNSLDVVANIVSLCSHCHNHLHYGKGIEIILGKIYKERAERLKNSGIEISFAELIKLY